MHNIGSETAEPFNKIALLFFFFYLFFSSHKFVFYCLSDKRRNFIIADQVRNALLSFQRDSNFCLVQI